jgi:hypothetical protein
VKKGEEIELSHGKRLSVLDEEGQLPHLVGHGHLPNNCFTVGSPFSRWARMLKVHLRVLKAIKIGFHTLEVWFSQ